MSYELPKLPDDYGTPAHESRWIRVKLKLPPDASTADMQGAMHVQESHANGYERYIVAFKCDDKQGEIARQSVRIAELEAQLKPAPEIIIGDGVTVLRPGVWQWKVGEYYDYRDTTRGDNVSATGMTYTRIGDVPGERE